METITTTKAPLVVIQARRAGDFFRSHGELDTAQFLAFFARRILLGIGLIPEDFGQGCDLIDLVDAITDGSTLVSIAA